MLESFEYTSEIISGIRTIRKEQNIPNKDQCSLEIINNQQQQNNFNNIIIKLGNISDIKNVKKKPDTSFSFMVKSNEFFMPIGNSINIESELKKLKKELEYNQGFLKSVENKLNNEKFVKNAPSQVVDNEKNKMIDIKSKIQIITNKISSFQKP